MGEVERKIIRSVFFGLREIERAVQKEIKKLTALDKMLDGVYEPSGHSKQKDPNKIENGS